MTAKEAREKAMLVSEDTKIEILNNDYISVMKSFTDRIDAIIVRRIERGQTDAIIPSDLFFGGIQPHYEQLGYTFSNEMGSKPYCQISW